MTKRRRTQAERTAASDNAMFKAAIAIIAKEGPNNMTLAKVGKEAGYTGGLVSYRFGSKSGLLQAVSERIQELWLKKSLFSPELANLEGGERLKMNAAFYLESVAERSELMLALHRLIHASYGSFPDLLPYFQDFDERARSNIAEILEQTESLRADIDPRAFATIYLASLRGIAQMYFVNPAAIDLEATKTMIWKMCDDAVEHTQSAAGA